MMRKSALFLMICCGRQGVVYAQLQVPGNVGANPGRPTISTPATLTPAGYLQLETGFSAAQSSPEFESRYSLINVVKLALSPRLEFLVSIEPIAHFTTGSTRNATADYFVGAQGVLIRGTESKPTVSLSYSRRLFDGAAPEPDFESPINSFLLLASADVKGFHYDANAFLNELVNKPHSARSVWPIAYGFSLAATSIHRLRGNLGSLSLSYAAMHWAIFGQSVTKRGRLLYSTLVTTKGSRVLLRSTNLFLGSRTCFRIASGARDAQLQSEE